MNILTASKFEVAAYTARVNARLEANVVAFEASPEYAEQLAEEAAEIAAQAVRDNQVFAAVEAAQKAERAAMFNTVRDVNTGRVLRRYRV